MPFLQDILATLAAGGLVVYPLLALAVLAMLIILDKGFVFARRARLPAAVVARIAGGSLRWDEIEALLAALDRRNYLRAFLATIIDNRRRSLSAIEVRAQEAASLVGKALDRGLWLLETIVTAAPLLGLLGTIAGMVRAFRLFGSGGLEHPGEVTGGVAEALIATALGLFIALLALFAFNYFSHLEARLLDEMERLGSRLVERIRQEREVGDEAA